MPVQDRVLMRLVALIPVLVLEQELNVLQATMAML